MPSLRPVEGPDQGHRTGSRRALGPYIAQTDGEKVFVVCPDSAVVSLGMHGEYFIDLDYGRGSGICVSEYPCGAIEMVPEQI